MSALSAHLRLLSLVLSTAFGIVAMSTGINALAKSNDQKKQLRKDVPDGASVSIDTHDVFASGVVVTVVSGLIALVSFLALVHAFLLRFRLAKQNAARAASPLHARTLPLTGAHTLAFLAVWLFATLVPFTDFVANRQAKVSASIGGVALPASIIQAAEQQFGLSPVYHKLGYLRAGTILPWFAFLFATTSSVLSYVYARQAARLATVPPQGGYVANADAAGVGAGTATGAGAGEEKRAEAEGRV